MMFAILNMNLLQCGEPCYVQMLTWDTFKGLGINKAFSNNFFFRDHSHFAESWLQSLNRVTPQVSSIYICRMKTWYSIAYQCFHYSEELEIKAKQEIGLENPPHHSLV